MATTDPRIDAYVAKAAPFARPVLLHLRAVVHAAVPDVEETIKWGFPHFVKDGIVCSFAAFKAHCAFNLWKGRKLLGDEASRDAMGQFGRIASVADLPPRAELVRLVRQAAALNAPGAKAPRAAAEKAPAKAKKPRPEAKVPPDPVARLVGALARLPGTTPVRARVEHRVSFTQGGEERQPPAGTAT
ncbi:MAG TPA: DUF1801 domain-containing protein, partial [Anaeromyxobacteraceae bacterium]|nr:DUF1801 domain-containing protein [Anaeromyxobacteraceae bacterium]